MANRTNFLNTPQADPIDPDFPPIIVQPWESLHEQHAAHVAWRQTMRQLTRHMRATGPATAGTRGGYFHRGLFIDKGQKIDRETIDRAMVGI